MSEAHDRLQWDRLAGEPFVSLGTRRRNGELVRTPVWMAADGPDLVVTTEVSTGKVKRLRREPRVVLQPCSRTGTIAPDSPTVEAHGVVDESPSGAASAQASLRRKYGLPFAAFLAVEAVVRRLQRRNGRRVILRISLLA